MKSALLTIMWFGAAAALTLIVLIMLFLWDTLPQWTILFYRGLLLCGISTALTFCLLLLACRKWPCWQVRDAVSAATFAAAVNLCFFVLFPVTIDRSISVFILDQMAARPGHSFTVSEMRQIVVDRFVDDYEQIGRRLEEQHASGNVVRADTGYRISANGLEFMHFARLLSGIFRTDPRWVDFGNSPVVENQLPSRQAIMLRSVASGRVE
jgi:hypothetical protein